jgi:GLPGLI family protein
MGQVEFMTRHFRIVNEIDKPAWKLTDKRTKILDYTCISAELQKGEDVYVAYFTSEIPVSLGPDEFIGLPGLVLAVEKNGETVYLATSVELGPLEESIPESKDGKKVSQQEFDNILQEKVREFEETRENDRRERSRR